MKKIALLALLAVSANLFAQQPIEVALWPNGALNSNGLEGKEENMDNGRIANVQDPSITIYKSATPNSPTIIMCPGGGYARLAMNHEGHDMAPWLTAQGITYVVLKYRMPNGNYEVPLSDAEQAIRLVRQHAAEWNVNPQKVGIMGASAGGHLASTLATHYSSSETRPDFQILLYPVITMNPEYTHAGSRENLLGKSPSEALEKKFSNELQVTVDTPKTFIVLSSDDKAVVPPNSINYYLSLLKHKVSATLHAYPIGGHGWGFRDNFTYKRQWTAELEKWLQEEVGLVCPSSSSMGKQMLKNGLSLLNTPYVAHTLERSAQEALFTDRSELDCTTFVESVMAMSLCSNQNPLSESEFAQHLQKIRYRQGVLNGYTSRLHYIADWINDNVEKGLIEDVTAMHSTDKEHIVLNFMSTHPDKYKHLKDSPKNVAEMAKHEKRLTGQEVYWLPKDKIPNEGLPWIKDGDIIVLTTNIKGLDVSHMGLAIYQDGNLHLLHASSIKMKVIIDPDTLRNQLQKSKYVTGIRVLRIRP